jgi:hypothetical protein
MLGLVGVLVMLLLLDGCLIGYIETVRLIIYIWVDYTRYGNTLRFPRAAGEPPQS